MGILTNALNQLVSGVIGVGVDQLDNYFTGLIESGRQAEAAEAAMKLDQELAQRGLMQDQLMSGQFNTPGMDLAGGAAMDPNSAQGKGILSSLATLPYIDPSINQSPTHSQLAVQRGTQFIQQNPLVQQRELAQKAQEERMGLVKSLVGEGYKQNQMGFQEGLGAFDNPAGYDLPREERNRRSQERQFGQTTAQYQAAEPYKEKANQRTRENAVFRKSLKGGGGGGDSGGSDIVSSATEGEINKIQRQLMQYPEYVETGLDGKPTLNALGQNAAYKAAEILQTQKKKNYLKAAKEGRDAERKEFQAQQEKTSTPQGRLDVLRGRATTPEAQQRLQEVEQQLKQGQQATPAPTATQQTPQERAAEVQTNRFPGNYPYVQNPDGSRSNVKLGGFEIDGRNYVIPTMVNGKQLTPDEAVAIAKQQGLDKYPSFATRQEADNYAQSIHSRVDEQGRIGRTQEASQLTDQDRKDIERMKKPVSEGGLGWNDEQVNKFLRDAGKIK